MEKLCNFREIAVALHLLGSETFNGNYPLTENLMKKENVINHLSDGKMKHTIIYMELDE